MYLDLRPFLTRPERVPDIYYNMNFSEKAGESVYFVYRRCGCVG